MEQEFSSQKQLLTSALKETPDLFIKSPGRFNLIGEHTDYNGGFVMPGCLDLHIYFGFKVLSRSTTNNFLASALPLSISSTEWVTIDTCLTKEGINDKIKLYLSGVFDYLINKAKHNNESFVKEACVKLVISSTLPIGAGVSSSAALCVGFACGLNKLYNLKLSQMELAHCARYAEN